MKFIKHFLPIFALLCAVVTVVPCLHAQEDDDRKKQQDIHEMTPENINDLRPGMELRKIGGINMLVPEGVQFYMEGSQLKMEEAGEYAARRFKDVEGRLGAMEEREKKLEDEIEKLQESLKSPRNQR